MASICVLDGDVSWPAGYAAYPSGLERAHVDQNLRFLDRIEKHNRSVYSEPVNSRQLKKWLEQQGATFQAGKGSHLKVFLNGRQSVLPMHGTAELGKGLEAAIKRQLGLK